MSKSKKKLQDIFHMDTDDIDYDTYLTEDNLYYEEIKRKFEDILKDDNNYDIIAPTGSGKTTAIINFSKEFKSKVIILVPYEINVRQLAKKHKLTSIYDFRKRIKNGTLESLNLDIIVSTFDGILDLSHSTIDLREYCLVIDEYHNYFVQLELRGRVILASYSQWSDFKKVITITGTPEGIYLPSRPSIMNRFLPISPPEPIDTDLILFDGDIVQSWLKHFESLTYEGKVVVYLNDKDKIEEIKKELIRKKRFKKNEIAILTQETKGQKPYKQIIDDEKLDNRIKIVLCTMLISDGINVDNEDIGVIYILDESNLILFRQFYRRFRNFNGHIFDFIKPEKNVNQNIDCPAGHFDRVEKGFDNAKLISDMINKQVIVQYNINKRADNRFLGQFFSLFASNQFIYFDNENWATYPSIFKATMDSLSLYFWIAHNLVRKRIEYFKVFEERLVYKRIIDMRNGIIISHLSNIPGDQRKKYCDFIYKNLAFCQYYTLSDYRKKQTKKPEGYEDFLSSDGFNPYVQKIIKELSFYPMILGINRELALKVYRNLQLAERKKLTLRVFYLIRKKRYGNFCNEMSGLLDSTEDIVLYIQEIVTENNHKISNNKLEELLTSFIQDILSTKYPDKIFDLRDLNNWIGILYNKVKDGQETVINAGKPRRVNFYKYILWDFENIFKRAGLLITNRDKTFFNRYLRNQLKKD